MAKIDPKDISNARGLAFELLDRYEPDLRAVAFAVAQMYEGCRPLDIWQDPLASVKAGLAARICEMAIDGDDPRYSVYDYVDAVINARKPVDCAKLLDLPDADFTLAMAWLAQYKRESYEDRPHGQAPLALDIYASGEMR